MRNVACLWLVFLLALLPLSPSCAEEESMEAARLTDAERVMWTAEIAPEELKAFAFTAWAYRADLNRDGVPELYGNGSMGSGITSSYIRGYDPVTKECYLLNERMAYDCFFTLYQETLYVVRIRSFMYDAGDNPEEDGGAGPRAYAPLLRAGEGAFDLNPVEAALEAEIIDAARDADGTLRPWWRN